MTVAEGVDPRNHLPGDRDFSLGDESFPGYQHDELRVGGYWTVGGSFLWRLADVVSIKRALFAAWFCKARVSTIAWIPYGRRHHLRLSANLGAALGGTLVQARRAIHELWLSLGARWQTDTG